VTEAFIITLTIDAGPEGQAIAKQIMVRILYFCHSLLSHSSSSRQALDEYIANISKCQQDAKAVRMIRLKRLHIL
jgi:hypothetical protein